MTPTNRETPRVWVVEQRAMDQTWNPISAHRTKSDAKARMHWYTPRVKSQDFRARAYRREEPT